MGIMSTVDSYAVFRHNDQLTMLESFHFNVWKKAWVKSGHWPDTLEIEEDGIDVSVKVLFIGDKLTCENYIESKNNEDALANLEKDALSMDSLSRSIHLHQLQLRVTHLETENRRLSNLVDAMAEKIAANEDKVNNLLDIWTDDKAKQINDNTCLVGDVLVSKEKLNKCFTAYPNSPKKAFSKFMELICSWKEKTLSMLTQSELIFLNNALDTFSKFWIKLKNPDLPTLSETALITSQKEELRNYYITQLRNKKYNNKRKSLTAYQNGEPKRARRVANHLASTSATIVLSSDMSDDEQQEVDWIEDDDC